MRFSDAGKSFVTRNNSCNNEPTVKMVTQSPRFLAGSCLVSGLHELRSVNTPYYQLFDHTEYALEREEVVDVANNSHMEKKRRLTSEQVKSLEVSFDLESKLEPERKNLLAQELGLQPRQVAIWFQNRRARSKTKQLERDYDLLKGQYEAVIAENQRLEEEVKRLHQLLEKECISKEENDTDSQVTVNADEEKTIKGKETNRLINHSMHVDDGMLKQKLLQEYETCNGTEHISEKILESDKQKSLLPPDSQHYIVKSPLERLYNALYMQQIALKAEDGDCTQEELYSNGFFTVDDHPPMLSLDWS